MTPHEALALDDHTGAEAKRQHVKSELQDRGKRAATAKMVG